ncbi:MAG: glycosyltransferase [Candidatus Acidiferrum sp.]
MPRVFVSVLIDTYNHERYIEDAVNSALAQDFPASDREIVVVDDGSTDRTPEVLAKFGSQIRILRKPNGGQASAFNLAIPQCRGEIVSMLDGDDWWAPDKVSRAAAAFAERPSVGIVGHGNIEVYPDGATRIETIKENPYFHIDSVQSARLFRLRKSFLGTCRMSCRADLLRRILPVPESLIVEADEYIFTLAAFFSDVFILSEPLLFYRIHGQNWFNVSDGKLASLQRKHAIMVALGESLRQRFSQENIPENLSEVVLECVQTEADMLALSLGRGSPLTTIRTELRNYRIMQGHASLLRGFLKCVSLFPALFVSPARYVAFKQKLAANTSYRRAREAVLPFYRPKHVDYIDEKSSR